MVDLIVGCEIAIADSPLIQNPMYAKEHTYFLQLSALTHKVNEEFDNTYIYIERTKPYTSFGRTQQTVEEAKLVDTLLADAFHYDLTVTGDAEGQAWLGQKLDKRFNL